MRIDVLTLPGAIGMALRRLYDPAVRLTTPELRLRQRLIRQAAVAPDHRVLDVGCGTGSVTIAAARSSTAAVVGIDRDPGMVQLAKKKRGATRTAFSLVVASATQLPFPAGVFDRVLTMWMLHHLTTAEKADALAEMYRVLRPGGELHVADWAPPHTPAMRAATVLLRWIEPEDGMRANLDGAIPALCADAGFAGVSTTSIRSTMFGSVAFLAARRLGPAADVL